MRTEGNPIKQNPALSVGYKRHRIIMPVFIPSHEGYYKDAFKIFKICLQSLIDTTDRKFVNITIINNASVPEVNDLVNEKLVAGEVDQYIHNQVNRGKADAIVGAAKASYEPFITIADADVLFTHGWLSLIDQAYKAFPHAGIVAPFPSPHLKFHFTTSTWIRNIFRIGFKSIVNVEDLDLFEKNLGLQDYFSTTDKSKQFYISKGKIKVLIGAGHFVAVYRKSVFSTLKYSPTLSGLKGGLRMIDRQVDTLGLSRISLLKNRVLHMGNVYEEWMRLDNMSLQRFEHVEFTDEYKTHTWSRFIPYFIRLLVIKSLQYTYLALVKFRML